eukprot:163175_1
MHSNLKIYAFLDGFINSKEPCISSISYGQRHMQMSLFHSFCVLNRQNRLNSLFCKAFSTVSEIWTDINGFSQYQISSLGNVKNIKRNRLLTINNDRFKILNSTSFVMLVSDSGKKRRLIVGRVVLNSFDPNDDSDNLFAIHIDGNKYNNKLSNLQWSDKCQPHSTNKSAVAINLESVTSSDNMHFESVTNCAQYFNRVTSTISRWCYDKSIKHGYQFMFADKTKYLEKVHDLKHEKWKLFHETTSKKIKYYISSCGRAKRESKTGKETLEKTYILDGYHVLSRKLGNNSRLISRLVAKYHVFNPHNYTMVDHIDCNLNNNNMSNLRWVKDQKQNFKNPISKQRRSEASQIKRKVEQLSLDGDVIKTWDRPIHIQKSLGYNSGYIVSVCNGQSTAYGYYWRFHNS